MSKKIVVIDDEEDVLKITRASLTTRGYHVETFSGGEEALEHIESDPPDLILCDLMMPRVSGLEVLKRLRRDEQLAKIPVIILSALGNDDRPPEFWVKTLGVDDYIQKPFDPLDLLGRVEYLFRRGSYISSKGGGGAGFARVAGGRQAAPAPAVATHSSGDDITHVPFDLEESTPADVVRAFVESYSRQDFATEYECLADEMTGSLSRHDYVERRRQTYVEEKSRGRVQRVLDVEEEKVSLNAARVVISREDVIGGVSKVNKEAFTLKKTPHGWRIIGCRLHKTFPTKA